MQETPCDLGGGLHYAKHKEISTERHLLMPGHTGSKLCNYICQN
uniref:Uncharacterized protein n=1 Tax=Anguilla anguilla TaxID=7936 RepID=A0A0E9W856_ANGAN